MTARSDLCLNSPIPGAEDDYRRASRCPHCQLTPGLCLCAAMPKLEIGVRFVVVRHASEIESASSTGGLIPRLFPGSQVIDYGRAGHSLRDVCLARSSAPRALLFPSTGAPLLDSSWSENSSPPLTEPPPPPELYLADGSWSKAKRMIKRTPFLHTLPRYRLPLQREWPRRDSALRKPPEAGHYSTIDACLLALTLLKDFEAAGRAREFWHELRLRRLHLRGKRRRPR